MRVSLRSLFVLLALGACDPGPPDPERTFVRADLVSDRDGQARRTDLNLVGPWGLAASLETPFWVANHGTSTATLYDAQGDSETRTIGGAVSLPIASESDGVTGLVAQDGEGFVIASGAVSGASRFVFATLGGALIGWSSEVDASRGIIAYDASSTGAGYTGLAILSVDTRTLLYAADFASGEIDVYDESFAPADRLAPSPFVDPDLPAGYAPFGVHADRGRIYVTYAQRNSEGTAPAGAGGFVSVFANDGAFVARVASGEPLDAPWGFARAPSEIGAFSNALLVGNAGDGRITALDPQTSEVLGQLENADGTPIVIDGLRALQFGNDHSAGSPTTLYFTAAPDGGTHGVFGTLARPEDDD